MLSPACANMHLRPYNIARLKHVSMRSRVWFLDHFEDLVFENKLAECQLFNRRQGVRAVFLFFAFLVGTLFMHQRL